MSTFTLSNQSVELWLWFARSAGLMIGLIVLAAALKHWQRSHERDAQRVFEQLDLMRSELMLLQEQVSHHESQPAPVPKVTARVPVAASAAPPRPAPLATPAVAPRGYEVAARLARSGATVSELISNCGLSRHEAQLLIRLHAVSATPPKTESSSAVISSVGAPAIAPARPAQAAVVKPNKTVIDTRRVLAVG